MARQRRPAGEPARQSAKSPCIGGGPGTGADVIHAAMVTPTAAPATPAAAPTNTTASAFTRTSAYSAAASSAFAALATSGSAAAAAVALNSAVVVDGCEVLHQITLR